MLQEDLKQDMLTALYFIKISLAVEKKGQPLPDSIIKVINFLK